MKGYYNSTTIKKVVVNVNLIIEEDLKMANNRIVVPEARQALNQLKLEIANELGIENYNNIDKGNLPSRANGYVGGYMVKKLVEDAQNQIKNK